ncbi:Putative sodium-dependent multivitamin transporter-like Protein [Tribolium castaneum]|uniref:Sodium-dependent multivitamin transporter-like Protein n=1 Tax=Tribolium castaneum TaxID=7070 RepID=A0A139WIB2_TRICA|nr:Putative sodium-dependent multivitamin transporter-like Protein [Tribolium castaneum]
MKQSVYYFDIVDYIIFGAMLFLSALTGIYFGCRGKINKKREPESFKDYLTGNKNLKPFPVAMSLIASYISGVTMLGTPAEVYNFGAQYWLIVFAMSLSGLTVATVYLPVFTKLQVCSSYEYLELRFSKILRTIASLLFLLDEIMFLPMLIYVPSLAFNQVSGANLHLIGAIVCTVCVFYTILGGLRAVVYTDTWQTVVMFISDMVVVILGVVAIGGMSVIIERSSAGNRIQSLNFNPSMYERYTVFSVLIGGFTYWTSFNAVNQTMVQRYLSLPNNKEARIAIAIFTVGVVFFISMCCFAGLLLFGTYHDCDPLAANRISNSDQLLPLFVVETAGHLRGVPGLFIAGVFGAALSSLSVVLNSSAVVLLEDFFRGVCHFSITERQGKLFTKSIILILGIASVCLVFVVEKMGSVFAVATSLSAIVAGTMFGVFTLGMLVPWANVKGAVVGSVSGFLMSCIVSYGQMYVASAKMVVPRPLPVSIEGCAATYGLNVTEPPEIEYPDESKVFPLFRLSFLWITPIGVFTVIAVGIITSFLTGKTDLKTLDPELISPVMHWVLPEEAQNYAGSAVRKIKHQRLFGNEAIASPSVTMNLNVLLSYGDHEEGRTDTSAGGQSNPTDLSPVFIEPNLLTYSTWNWNSTGNVTRRVVLDGSTVDATRPHLAPGERSGTDDGRRATSASTARRDDRRFSCFQEREGQVAT